MAAWIKGATAEVGPAIEAAAALLAQARAPVIAGLAADIDALRGAFRLAATLGASLDPVGAASLYADLSALASAGAVTTTPSEALLRADLVLAVGRAAGDGLVEELARTVPSLGRGAGRGRTVLGLGSVDGAAPGSVAVPSEALPAAIGLLRALSGGRLAADDALGALARRLREAAFAVLIYDPAELGDLAVEMLQGLAADLNETTRAFTLGLADPWQGRTALQVSNWTTAQAPRVGFGRARPEHDPWRFDGGRQAAEGEIDAVIWLAALPAPRPGWSRALPSVAVVGEGGGEAGDVVIGVGVPGEGAAGTLFDARRGSLVFRPARRPDGRPTAAAALAAIEAALSSRALAARGAAC